MQILRIIAVVGWLVSSAFSSPRLWQADPPEPQDPQSKRLVVFEGFFKPG